MDGGALDRAIARVERARALAWRERRLELRALFESRTAPGRPLDGEYDGRLVLITIDGALGAVARAWTRRWMPWKGKCFHADSGLGDNRFSADARLPLRLCWPGYRGVRPAGPGHIRAFTFVTRVAASVVTPSHTVLRIDYDLDENPRFWIRDVVDELVEVDPDRYLGEAQVRHRGVWRTAAYFALRPADAPA